MCLLCSPASKSIYQHSALIAVLCAFLPPVLEGRVKDKRDCYVGCGVGENCEVCVCVCVVFALTSGPVLIMENGKWLRVRMGLYVVR
jgi:hypothetical protein